MQTEQERFYVGSKILVKKLQLSSKCVRQRNGDEGVNSKCVRQCNGDEGVNSKCVRQRNGDEGVNSKCVRQRNGDEGVTDSEIKALRRCTVQHN